MVQDSAQPFQIGASVLADVRGDGAFVPGVVEDSQGDRFMIHLAQPWVDETGQQQVDTWLTSDRLQPMVGSGGAAEQALPSPQ